MSALSSFLCAIHGSCPHDSSTVDCVAEGLARIHGIHRLNILFHRKCLEEDNRLAADYLERTMSDNFSYLGFEDGV